MGGLSTDCIVRELSLGDLIRGGEERADERASVVLRMRESHHGLARLLAQGLKDVEISAITGYCQSRISILKGDPAFRELVEHYRSVKESAFADVYGQVATFGANVLAELRDRLEETPEEFKNRELLDILNSMLDRTGYGRSTKVQAEVVHVSGEELVRLKELAKEGMKGNVTPELAQAEGVGQAAEQRASEDRGAEVGTVVSLWAKVSEGATQGA